MYREIESLVTLGKKGDRSSKEKLLFKLKPLILSSIKRYYNDYSQYDDFIQEGYEIILNCIKNYDNSKETKFLGYVKLQLKYHYLDKHKEKSLLSLNETIDDGEEFIDYIKDDGFGPLEIAINNQERESLYRGLSSLSKRQREIFISYYIKGMNMVDISKELDISYRTVVNTKTKAVEKMKKIINKNI